MSGFSSSKKRDNDGSPNSQDYFSLPLGKSSPIGQTCSSHSAGAGNLNISPAPNQFPMNFSPNQRSDETPFSRHHRSTQKGHYHKFRRGSGSPNTNSGRGNHHQVNSIPIPAPGRTNGRGRGRGRGSHAFVLAKDQPEMFYRKAMVEDPWRSLKPVDWNLIENAEANLKTPDSLKSWLPESLRMKKAKTSEVSAGFSFQSSLADCLSLAFEEAIEEVHNN